MTEDNTKFHEMALLLTQRSLDTDGRCRGDKIDALMFWADAAAHHALGASISGATYHKHRLGPRPDQMTQAIKDMSDSSAIRTDHTLSATSVLSWYIPQRKADPSMFSDAELAIMASVSEQYGPISPNCIAVLARQEPSCRAASYFQKVQFQAPHKPDPVLAAS